jgi:hypothetical protein
MGAYDNMFSHASTFKVELDEWYVLQPEDPYEAYPFYSCKILRDATPKSLVILDGMFRLFLVIGYVSCDIIRTRPRNIYLRELRH